MASTRLPVCTPESGASLAGSGRGMRRRTVRSGGSSIMVGLFHRGERGRLQDLVGDGGNDRTVLLGLCAGGEPGWVGHEGTPLLLALGERLPLQEIVEFLVRLADQRRPKARLTDTVLLPELERNGVEALDKRRQAAGHAAIDAQLVDHGRFAPLVDSETVAHRARSEQLGAFFGPIRRWRLRRRASA